MSERAPRRKPSGKAKKSPTVQPPADAEKAASKSPPQQDAHPDNATEEEIRSWEDAYRKEQLWKRDHLPAMQKEAASELAAFEKTAKILFNVSEYAPEILDSAPLTRVMDLCLQMLRKTIKLRRDDAAVVPLLQSMNYGCDVLAATAIHGKSEGVRLAAAEQLLGITGDCLHWLGQVTAKGILDERIKHAIAWPVVVGLQPKDPRYHKKVVSYLNQKKLGSLALIGRNNRSGGKGESFPRAWANHVHGVIFTIHGLKELPAQRPDRQRESHFSWDTSQVLGDMAFSVKLIVSCHSDLVRLIKLQPSLMPSEKLWDEVAKKILFAFQPELKEEKSGRRKKGVSPVDPTGRRERAAIRQAYIDLANVPNKSHDIAGKYGDSKTKKRRKLK
jgi:hypothetical protein